MLAGGPSLLARRLSTKEATDEKPASEKGRLVTDFDHDGLDRQVEVTYDVGGIALVNTVSYDDQARTVTRTDGKSQDTVYTLDGARDVVTKIEYAAHDAASTNSEDWDNRWFAYDRAGRLTDEAFSEEPEEGETPTWDVTYTYDLVGRLGTRTNHVAGSGEEKEAHFTYDYQGRLLTAQTRLSSPSTEYDTEVVRTYNSLFLTRELQRIHDGGAWKEFTIRTDGGGGTGYDAGGRRVRIEYPNDADLDATGTSAERLLTFEYDGNDRLEKILDHPDPNDPNVTDTLGIYRYAGPGLRIAELDLHGDRTDPLNDPTEIEKTVAYDYLRRPTETEYRFTDTGEKREYRETWGDGTWVNSPEDTERVGALRRETLQKVTVDSLGNETVELTHSYLYDAIDRLVSFDSGATTFGYDPANNLAEKNGDTHNHNASNEITDIQDSSQQTLCTFTHDNRGNLTEKNCGTAESFAYDLFNRLVSYESTWTYVYDGLGRRVKKSDGAATHLYLHDGSRVILEVTGSEVREYIHGLGIDEVLMEEIDAEIFWPLVDSLGTVRDLADLDGSGNARVRMEYDYSAYGEVEESDPTGTGLVAQDVLFTGRRLDRESGIYYYRARHYDPEVGRFLQRDPIGVWEDVENLGNGYAYVGGDPLNGRDPFGLQQAMIEEFADDECTNEPVGWPIRICCQYETHLSGYQETRSCNPWNVADIKECCPDYGGHGWTLVSAYEGSCPDEDDEDDLPLFPPVCEVDPYDVSRGTREVDCCCTVDIPLHITPDVEVHLGDSYDVLKTVRCPGWMDAEDCCSPCEPAGTRPNCETAEADRPRRIPIPTPRPGARPGQW